MRRRPLIAAALLACLLPRAGHAQPSDVTPPELETDHGVTYPEQALREGLRESVVVDLVLEIDATGAVTAATVDRPQGHGFDEAATAAARALVFTPARRSGKPVAARIRFTYAFAAPASRLTGKVLSQATDAAVSGATVSVRDAAGVDHTVTTDADGAFRIDRLPPGAAHLVVSAPGNARLASDETLIANEETSLVLRLSAEARLAPVTAPGAEAVTEVTVHGDRPPREVTKRTLTRDEIDKIPGTNGDALKSLQNLPGVARPPLFSNGLVVRGSAPQDTGIFLDGTNIPLIYHFGGLSSVVPTEVLEKIDFYPGNFSSVYGRGMGGIVDAGIRDPKKDHFHAMGQVDLIDIRLLAEGPIAKGWSFLVAGRRSYFDLWLTPILKGANVGITTAPVYYDYQAILEKDLGPHETLRFLFFGSDDVLSILNQNPSASDPGLGGQLDGHTAFWRAQARYQNALDDKTSLRVQASYGQDTVSLGAATRYQKTTTKPLAGRIELSDKIARGVTANTGFDIVYESYDLHFRRAAPRRPGQPDLGATDTPIDVASSGSLFLPGMYTEWEIVPMPGIRIVPGVRADYDSTTKNWDLAPRLSSRQDLTKGFPRTTLKEGIGIYDQPPTPVETDPRYGQLGLESNRSVHFDVGVEQEVTRNVEVTLDGYAKSLDHLVVNGAQNAGTGSVYGLEMLLKYKADEHFFGWVSYSLSRSVRRDLPSDPLRLFQYDQTHVLSMVGSYKLGRGWQLGARFRLISGPLDTASSYGAFDGTAGAQLSVDGYPPYSQRLPLFHQLDLRADKTWTFPTWKLTTYLDIQNVYSRQAAEALSYNYNFTQSTYTKGLPILPSLGLRAEF